MLTNSMLPLNTVEQDFRNEPSESHERQKKVLDDDTMTHLRRINSSETNMQRLIFQTYEQRESNLPPRAQRRRPTRPSGRNDGATSEGGVPESKVVCVAHAEAKWKQGERGREAERGGATS